MFQSVSGSPGVSVWSVLTLGLWPTDHLTDRVAVEADPAGGVMGVRYQLNAGTDLLIADSARWVAGSSIDMSQFASKVGDGAWLVPGPKTPESTARLWNADGAPVSIAAMAAGDSRVWLFDAGRATPVGQLEPLFSEAAVSVLFTRGAPEELAKTRHRVQALKSTGAHVMVAVTGKTTHSEAEVSEFLGLSSVHFLPGDDQLVDDSRQVWAASRKGRRRNVWAAGSAFATAIAEVLEYSPRGVMRVEAGAL